MSVIPDNSDERDKLRDEIEKLESVRVGVEKPKLPDVKLEETVYKPPSDEYLELLAKDALSNYKKQGEAAIRSDSAADAEALDKNRAQNVMSRDGELAALDKAYKTASDSIDADIIRRGLARSSIAVNEKSELYGERARQESEILRAYGDKIADIDAQISTVSQRLESALGDFNLSYAQKLNDKLEELKADRDKKAEEALKYNNSIKEKQAKLDADRLATESKLYSEALSQHKTETSLDSLSPEARNDLYKSVYKKMDEFLSSLSEREAKLEIRNHTLYRDHLSDYYYYKLYDKYGR